MQPAPNLLGVIPFSEQRPSLGLVVFSDRSTGVKYVQKIDPVSGKGDGYYELTDISPNDPIVRASYDRPIYNKVLIGCISADGLCVVGSAEEISSKLLEEASSEGSSHGYKLQVAALLGHQDKANDEFGKLSQHIKADGGERSLRSFADSAAFSVLWNSVQESSIEPEEKEFVFDALFLVRFRRDESRRISLDLSSLPERCISLIDCETIEELIHQNVTLPIERAAHAAQNDNSNYRSGDRNTPIDANTLRLFLERRIGLDYRIRSWRYTELAETLHTMGFHSIEQIETTISGQNDDFLSHVATGNRQGQINRFEFALIAALGEDFFDRYPFDGRYWLEGQYRRVLDSFVANAIPIGVKAIQPDLFSPQPHDT